MPFAAIASAAVSAGKAFIGSSAATQSAGAAAGGLFAAKEVACYNRENFLEDREQRMKKEFQERKMRIKQGQLWREDVRDFVSLVERKMKYYLLVNVLLLGFNVNLWCEGRLPEHVPGWLMMGNQVAAAGSFGFLLLTVWLAMHAAVAAQSYEARVLTQLVRLPLPTWQEIEACRTYGSEYEAMEPRQMFRVPFIGGLQERLVAGSAAGAPRMDAENPAAAARAATDPWGMERRGDDLYELGTHYGRDVAELRHIKLIRQAAVYWQTYDAFARVSMYVGMNQLMVAMMYYILGYVMCQVRCPEAAFAGVMVLIATSEVTAYIDLTLSTWQWRLIQLLLFAGPGVSIVAAYNYGIGTEISTQVAEGLAPLAFLSHGAILALVTVFLRVREQANGAMLPLAFQGVLYLDVFGWIHDMPVDSKSAAAAAAIQDDTSCSNSAAELPAVDARPPAVLPSSSGALNTYAQSYLSGPDDNGGLAFASRPTEILHGENGKPLPTRPGDAKPNGAEEDMRNFKGAPRMWETVSAVDPPFKEFFEPVTFMPHEDRIRGNVDNMLDDNDKQYLEEVRTATGHDHESPGLMPWHIFSWSAMLLVALWLGSGVCALARAKMLPLPLSHGSDGVALVEDVVPVPSVLSLWSAGFLGTPIGPELEEVTVQWPYSSIRVRGLSCDADGRGVVATDGVSTLVADLSPGANEIGKPRQRLRRALRAAATALRVQKPMPTLSAVFEELPACPSVRGEAIADTALTCRDNATSVGAGCSMLVLHRRGHRVTVCSVGDNGASSDVSYDVSQNWLEATARHGGATTQAAEEVASILAAGSFSGSEAAGDIVRSGLTSLATSRGRVVRVHPAARASLPALVPYEEPDEEIGKVDQLDLGVVRSFNEHYMGVLQPRRRSIRVLDAVNGGASLGDLILPPARGGGGYGQGFAGFCAGGGYVYLLGDGPSPRLWRVPAPEKLRPHWVRA